MGMGYGGRGVCGIGLCRTSFPDRQEMCSSVWSISGSCTQGKPYRLSIGASAESLKKRPRTCVRSGLSGQGPQACTAGQARDGVTDLRCVTNRPRDEIPQHLAGPMAVSYTSAHRSPYTAIDEDNVCFRKPIRSKAVMHKPIGSLEQRG